MGRTAKCLSNWVTQGLRRGRANAERGMRNGKGKAEPSFAKASEGRLRDGGGGEPTRNAERGMRNGRRKGTAFNAAQRAPFLHGEDAEKGGDRGKA